MKPIAFSLYVAAVEGDEPPGDRQPDAQAARAGIAHSGALGEQPEDRIEHVRRDADTRVSNGHEHVAPVPSSRDLDRRP
jgi:hypothetical protein